MGRNRSASCRRSCRGRCRRSRRPSRRCRRRRGRLDADGNAIADASAVLVGAAGGLAGLEGREAGVERGAVRPHEGALDGGVVEADPDTVARVDGSQPLLQRGLERRVLDLGELQTEVFALVERLLPRARPPAEERAVDVAAGGAGLVDDAVAVVVLSIAADLDVAGVNVGVAVVAVGAAVDAVVVGVGDGAGARCPRRVRRRPRAHEAELVGAVEVVPQAVVADGEAVFLQVVGLSRREVLEAQRAPVDPPVTPRLRGVGGADPRVAAADVVAHTVGEARVLQHGEVEAAQLARGARRLKAERPRADRDERAREAVVVDAAAAALVDAAGAVVVDAVAALDAVGRRDTGGARVDDDAGVPFPFPFPFPFAFAFAFAGLALAGVGVARAATHARVAQVVGGDAHGVDAGVAGDAGVLVVALLAADAHAEHAAPGGDAGERRSYDEDNGAMPHAATITQRGERAAAAGIRRTPVAAAQIRSRRRRVTLSRRSGGPRHTSGSSSDPAPGSAARARGSGCSSGRSPRGSRPRRCPGRSGAG